MLMVTARINFRELIQNKNRPLKTVVNINTEQGKFIVIEGLEGAGKTTALAAISAYLTARSQRLIQVREPGGTSLGEKIRALIKNFPDENIDPHAELLLLYAARVQLIQNIIKPALAAGIWVLADRFELSTLAYQGGGRGIDYAIIYKLSALFLHGLTPDCIVFLDITPDRSLKRIQMRGLTQDRMELESHDFFYRVYTAYHAIIKNMNNVTLIDAELTPELVQQAIITVLKTL